MPAGPAAIMKMISSTRITSMNGVTLISWISLSSSSPWLRRTLIARSLGCRRRPAAFRRVKIERAAIEIAADDAQDFGRGIGM